MRLRRIEAENFLSIGPKVTLDLRRRGLIGVEGDNRDDPSATSNGAGKTAVFIDTVSWCLWGETTRGYDGDEVINTQARRNCLVKTYLTVRKQDVVIARARGHKQFRNRLSLVINGIDESKANIKDTQEAIERLLGMNAQTFLNSVMFGATPGYRFSALTDSQQKEVFDDALGIAQYARAYTLARDELKTAKAARDRHADMLDQHKAYLDDADKRLQDLKHKDKHHENEVADKLDRLRERRADLQEKIEKLKVKVAWDASKEISKVQDVIDELSKEHKSITDTLSKHESDDRAFKREGKHLKDAIDAVDSHDEDYTCIDCGSLVTASTRRSHKEKLSERLRVVEKKRTSNSAASVSLMSKFANVTRDLSAAKSMLTELKDKQAEMKALQATLDAKESELQDLDDQIKKTKRTKSPYASLIKKCRGEVKKWKRAASREERIVGGYTTEIEELEFWVDAYGTKGIRSYLIDTALPYLNDRAAYYAQMLTDGAVEITFKTQSKLKSGAVAEKFEVAVNNLFGADKYKGNSGGEKAKVDLCVGLALQDLVMSRAATKTNVAFFDEVFDRMDEAGVERAINVLTEVAKERESVFVVTHLDALKSYFPGTITVVKRKRTSQLEETT